MNHSRRNQAFSKLATFHHSAMGFSVWRVGPQLPSMPQAHTHPDVELNWVGIGRVEYTVAGTQSIINAGQLGIFWGGMPHQMVRSGPLAGIWLTLPLSWFLGCRFSNNLAEHLMSGRLLTQPLQSERAEQWLQDFEVGPPRARLVLLELEALLERTALAMQQVPRRATKMPGNASNGLNYMERILAYLSTNYPHPLAIADLAAVVNLHPKYLMTIFRQSSGMTINTYLLRLRLAHAQRLLATTDLRILDIAMESGFGSLGRFYEAFARNLGERPLHFRKRHAE